MAKEGEGLPREGKGRGCQGRGRHCSTRTVAAAHCSYSASLGLGEWGMAPTPHGPCGQPTNGSPGGSPRPRLSEERG